MKTPHLNEDELLEDFPKVEEGIDLLSDEQ